MSIHGLVFVAESILAVRNTQLETWPAQPVDPEQPYKGLTRRVVNFPARHSLWNDQIDRHKFLTCVYPAREEGWVWWNSDFADASEVTLKKYAFGLVKYRVGDLIYAKETWRVADSGSGEQAHYRADPDELDVRGQWKSSRFMPQKYARLWFEVMEVRPERVQAITVEDAIAEGLAVQMGDDLGPNPGFKWNGPGYCDIVTGNYHAPDLRNSWCSCKVGQAQHLDPAQCAFRVLWDSINAGRGFGYDVNPWVWRLGLKRRSPPTLDESRAHHLGRKNTARARTALTVTSSAFAV